MTAQLTRPGPDSLVFRRMADDRGLMIGGATLLLQVADRTVGAGVEQHSNFKAEPWRRLYGTLISLVRIVYGTTEEAGQEVERLRTMHRTIRGTDARGRDVLGAAARAVGLGARHARVERHPAQRVVPHAVHAGRARAVLARVARGRPAARRARRRPAADLGAVRGDDRRRGAGGQPVGARRAGLAQLDPGAARAALARAGLARHHRPAGRLADPARHRSARCPRRWPTHSACTSPGASSAGCAASPASWRSAAGSYRHRCGPAGRARHPLAARRRWDLKEAA